MPPDVQDNAFRFDKRRVQAVVTLVGGESARGFFFVAGERVGELLNLDRGFFPFEIEAAGGNHTVLYNRAHVITVALFESEAARDAGYAVARRRDIWMLLTDGRRIRGVVRVYRPEGR